MKTTITELKNANPKWFSPENKRFFGDISYSVKNVDGESYLIIYTYMWSDMFGAPKKAVYRIKKINEDLSLGDLYDEQFKTMEDVNTFLECDE